MQITIQTSGHEIQVDIPCGSFDLAQAEITFDGKPAQGCVESYECDCPTVLEALASAEGIHQGGMTLAALGSRADKMLPADPKASDFASLFNEFRLGANALCDCCAWEFTQRELAKADDGRELCPACRKD